MLGDFVDKTGDALDATTELGKISRIGVIATAADRRDADMASSPTPFCRPRLHAQGVDRTGRERDPGRSPLKSTGPLRP